VHINFPFREPFYPEKDEEIKYDPSVKVIKTSASKFTLEDHDLEHLLTEWNHHKRKLIIGGQHLPDEKLNDLLDGLSKQQKIPVIGDVISNLHGVTNIVAHPDVFLQSHKKDLLKSLQPDLVVSFGQSTISKNLKLFLREYQPANHWHIQPASDVADTFQSLTRVVHCDPEWFFEQLSSRDIKIDFDSQKQENYYQLWQIEERRVIRLIEKFFPHKNWGEFEVVAKIINQLGDVHLHLANSMAVRYANLIGIKNDTVKVFANRGTSGIDGSTSTAVGSSMESGKTTVLITGDMAFFYDRNAFWHNYTLDNLKIVVLNNHAGGIFRMINGPADQPELEEYFETKQPLTAAPLAKEFNISYLHCDQADDLDKAIQNFIKTSAPVILEVETDSKTNKEILANFKSQLDQID
ncbi:MAG: thiamine pyrophosphate-dependent enzyme, partial [Fulvivirga sp.]|nr:thiamine pyrophosphate-dependent enzyme [Fulvivirga sp.]